MEPFTTLLHHYAKILCTRAAPCGLELTHGHDNKCTADIQLIIYSRGMRYRACSLAGRLD